MLKVKHILKIYRLKRFSISNQGHSKLDVFQPTMVITSNGELEFDSREGVIWHEEIVMKNNDMGLIRGPVIRMGTL